MEGIGSKKLCPLITQDTEYGQHCMDGCEWNDGEGCAVWRIVKALEGLWNKLDLYGLGRGDTK